MVKSGASTMEAVMNYRPLLAAAVLILFFAPALGQVAMEGTFTASKACPATQSIKSGANPGAIMTGAGRAYRLVGKNKDEASHYFVEVPGAQPLRRWVAVSCGSVNGAAQTPPQAPKAAATEQCRCRKFICAGDELAACLLRRQARQARMPATDHEQF